ncbi:MAG: hypothetical protein RQ751_06190 [Longimicrobiales bacterium]|nr:hypothetical protein [Longimicrobiales bacterium]
MSGQERVLLGHSMKCPNCVVRLEETRRFGPDVVFGEPKAVAGLPDGSIAVSFFQSGPELYRIHADGHTELLARSGGGPSEVQDVSALVPFDDGSLLIWDSTRRRAFLRRADGSVGYAFPIPGAVHDVAYAGVGRYVVNAEVPSVQMAGIPLHLMGQDGVLEVSFGEIEGGLYRPDMPNLSRRSVASAVDRLWTVLPSVYEIDEWDRNGNILRTWVRNVPWFEGYVTRRNIITSQEYPPWIADIEILGEGLLAVVLHVGRDGWRDYLGEPVRTEYGVNYPEINVPAMTESVIEIFDFRDGTLIAATRMPGYIIKITKRSMLIEYTQSPTGFPGLVMYDMKVDGW